VRKTTKESGRGGSGAPTTAPAGAERVDPVSEACPVPTSPFQIREDGSIALAGTGELTPQVQVIPAQSEPAPPPSPPRLAYRDEPSGLWLYHGNCLELLDVIAAQYPDGRFDMIFADPPYFLSNGGITCHAGRMVKVDKGSWDKSRGAEVNHEFNTEWLRRCQRVLKPNGTIWVTGTLHVIFSVGYAMQQLGFKLLNDIAWEKPNPPPNLSCRYFTHSTETVLWAAKNAKGKHRYNYRLMRQLNGGKQMKTVWKMTAPANGEKALGKHPTQKPLALVERCLLASTAEGDLVLDPFLGSGTTAVAALRAGRHCVGIEDERRSLALAVARVKAEPEKTGELFSEERAGAAPKDCEAVTSPGTGNRGSLSRGRGPG
jgi:site-specific DNA-methyltransferase (adenine-specific)